MHGYHNESSLSRQVVKGVLWMGSGITLVYVARVMTLAVLARLLSPEDFGIMAAAMVVVSLSTMFGHLGVGPALVQRSVLKSAHIRAAFTLSLLLGGTLTLLIWTTAPLIERFFRLEVGEVLRALAPTFFLKGVSIVPRALLQREMRFRALAMIESVSYIAGYVGVGIPLAAFGFRVWALVGAHFTEVVVSSVGTLLLRPHDLRPIVDSHSMYHLLAFGGGYTIARIANYVSTQVDKLIVGRWLGAYSLGIYSRSYYLVNVVSTIFEATIGRVLFPAMAKLQHDQEQFATFYLYAISLISTILCPLIAVSIVAAPELIDVLLGEQWSKVVLPFQLLALGMFLGTLYEISHYLFMAKNEIYSLSWIQIIYAVLVIIGAWLGLSWNVTGVAIGVVGAMIANTLLIVALSLKLTKIAWRTMLSAFVPSVISGVILGSWAWVISQFLRRLELPKIIILVTVIVTCLFAWSLLWRISPDFFFGSIGSRAMYALLDAVPTRMQHIGAFIFGRNHVFRRNNQDGGNNECLK